ncbi:MAG: hypothetical protein CMH98_19035 [Oceanospirillaceae bacterium]|nr:hypothetical protein [Oceanospirillaceae bacterium]
MENIIIFFGVVLGLSGLAFSIYTIIDTRKKSQLDFFEERKKKEQLFSDSGNGFHKDFRRKRKID